MFKGFPISLLVGLFIVVLGCESDTVSPEVTTGPEILGSSQPSGPDAGDPLTLLDPGSLPDDENPLQEEEVNEQSTEEEEEPPVPPTPESSFENDCEDGVDNDADGLLDCNDPDCSLNEKCIENDCGDQKDNDGDGQVDCKDADCFGDSLCYNQSCLEFYECMVATGCNCTTGTTCPPPGTPQYDACQATCAEDPTGACVNTCFDSLNPTVAASLNSYEECRTTQCGNENTDEGFASCVLEECLLEYATCFYVGELDCSDFYYVCASDCGDDDACVDQCRTALSADGFIDAVKWDQCRDSLCDLNQDEELDSDACFYLGSFFDCVEEGDSCVPENLQEDLGTCADTSDCLLACTTFDDSSCVLECLELTGPSNIEAVSGIWHCMVETCGSTSTELTPQCAANALANSCQNEWTTCTSD